MKSAKLDLSKGVSLDLKAQLKLFDRAQVDVYPTVVLMLKAALNTQGMGSLVSVFDAAFGDAVKPLLNDAVKKALPKPVDFDIDIGLLLAEVVKTAAADATAIAGKILPPNFKGATGGRRLADANADAEADANADAEAEARGGRALAVAAPIVDSKGSISLGGIPASAQPASTPSGVQGEPSIPAGAPESMKLPCVGDKCGIEGGLGGGVIFIIFLLVLIVVLALASVVFKKKKDRWPVRAYSTV
jgi:hypothetical protein